IDEIEVESLNELESKEADKTFLAQIDSSIELSLPDDLNFQLDQRYLEDLNSKDITQEEILKILEGFPKTENTFKILPSASYDSKNQLKQDALAKIIQKKKTVFVLKNNELKDRLLEKYDVEAKWCETLEKAYQESGLCAIKGQLTGSFESDVLAIIDGKDLFKHLKTKHRRPLKRPKETIGFEIESPPEIGEAIVYTQHGIGIFEGIENMTIGEGGQDFIKIRYGCGSLFYLPVFRIEEIYKYEGSTGQLILDRLNSTQWQTRMKKAKEALMRYAKQLIETAGKRLISHAPIFKKTPEYDSFAEKFEHPETPDQWGAIEDIEVDFKKAHPMDRLLCGDVGFGKTEVALRAAYLAIESGYQVSYIAPTTLLVRQHLDTIQKRFKNEPIRIKSLSRLSAKTAQQTKQEIQKGICDFVVGTHAVFSNTLQFKNLGLIILDEEQHFGVLQKEILKERYPEAHMLTLTATPIPRTLQFSISGIKDLSLLTTSPIGRFPVKTDIFKFDEERLIDLIRREKKRKGQSFLVVPRIADIPTIQEILDNENISYSIVNGQLPVRQMETAIEEFSHQETDVLIATAVIESGLDLGHVNTMIIYKAHKFGISQLYQLRGRVGRRERQAYCYLTYPAETPIGEEAMRRLRLIRAFSDLGSGFRLAQSDLDIRGAGNFFGTDQSGHMRELGMSLYQKMLAKEVKRQKAKLQQTDEKEIVLAEVDINLTAHFPKDYIKDEDLRLREYYAMKNIKSSKELSEFKEDIADKFGKTPVEVENMLNIIQWRIQLGELGVRYAKSISKGIQISFSKHHFPYDKDKLLQTILKQPAEYSFLPNGDLIRHLNKHNIVENMKELITFLEKQKIT
ncbi:MAG: DEAD/DEAH box helicase, partial [Alphaproteobacteria bacterium]|nr:DEAD/DEAH box helicase [Alphaproteobacteria bacterium]